MKKAITYSEILQNLKSHLIASDLGLTVEMSPRMLKPIDADKAVLIVPESVAKEETGSGFYEREITVYLYVLLKTARLYDDAGLLSLLNLTEDVEKSLQDETFNNAVIDPYIEIDSFDAIPTDMQRFIYGALLIYTAKIEGD